MIQVVPSPASADALLAPISLERARVIAPFVLWGTASSLMASESSGIPVTVPALAWNLFAIPVLMVMSIALWKRRVPARFGHAALAVLWWLGTLATVFSAYCSGQAERLQPLMFVEVSCLAILLQPRAVFATLAVFNALWIPIVVRELDGDSLYFSAMGVAQVGAILIHHVLRNALLRAETTAAALAHQLEERDRLNDQLVHAQRMEATGTLAAGLAHDMNNILASITNMAELRLEVADDDADDDARADLRDIITQSARGAELTRGLLAFSRKGQYRKVIIDADHVLRDLVPLLARTLPKSIEITTTLAADGANVQGDPTQLQQVIVNLGVNAADAMAGKGVLEISSDRTTLEPAEATALDLSPGSYVRVRVRDSGSGMDATTRKRAFEPFFTTKPLGKGTGLGLSMVWGIVKSHGGTVTIASEIDRGTTFTIYLPITTATTVPPTKRLPTEPLPHTTVLVVDDEPAVRASTMRLLKRQGLDVLGAENGVEALRVLAEHGASIGLVILDMAMPQMGGAECFAILRKTSNVPVLIATGFAVDEEVRALVAQGARLIEKPFPSAELVQEVRRLLSRAA